MIKDMQMMMNNFIVQKVFRDKTKQSLGICKFDIYYNPQVNTNAVPEELWISKNNTVYVYEMKGQTNE